MFFIDPVYLLIIAPALLLALYAQIKVKSAYATYSRIPNMHGSTGGDIARAMLYANGITDVQVEMTQGVLSDHYDPRSRTLRLSPDVYAGRSVAAAGIASHEAGHALQHYSGYAPLHLRSLIVPVVSVGSNLAWILFFIGIVFVRNPMLINAAIVLFSGTVLFTLVTLPVEYNASKRALTQLVDGNIIDSEEAYGVRKVLNAAALTYVAAALMAILQLLYMILRSRD
jgi:Zn-dependent membrane protease YugP